MTVQFFRAVGIAALIGAGLLLGASLKQVIEEEPPPLASRPSVIEIFANQAKTPEQIRESPPLVVQAEALARYLNPPTQALTEPRRQSSPSALVPARRPAQASPKFRLHATSYYPAHPEESRALIRELGGDTRNGWWVREGTRVGHFTIQEIRSGAVICTGGEQVHELFVEHGPLRTSLVTRHGVGLAQADPVQEGGTTKSDAKANAASKGSQ